MTDFENAQKILSESEFTCVLCKGDAVYTTTARGVRPLVKWLVEGTDLRFFSAADKVVGKATAYLYCLLMVKAVYAHVMSYAAAQVLEDAGIEVKAGKLVDNIINRKGDGICPFEAAVWDIQTAEEALPAIRQKMEEMHITL